MSRIYYLFPLLFLCYACDEDPPEEKGPPNIIFILADDLGYGDLGAYGQQLIATPHLDSLAAEGMIFDHFYAGSTVCAPSRVALLTGKHPGHVSVRGNQPKPQMIQDKEITIAEALATAGYFSGVIGKWGAGNPQAPDDPARNGFHYAYGYPDMVHAHNFYPEFLVKNGEQDRLEGNEARTDIDWSQHYYQTQPLGGGVAETKVTYAPDVLDAEALSFLERHQDTSFFLYLAYNTPHANNEAGSFEGDGMEVQTTRVEDDYVYNYGPYAEQEWPAPEKGFARMMHNLDQTVGMVRAKLRELGIADNTMIFFTSDNGPHAEGEHRVEFFDSNGPLRGKKRDLYEGGIRVPMIAHWPGHFISGRTIQPFAFWDVLPTLAELTGATPPSGIDGISFVPLLSGHPEQQLQHDNIYFEFYEQGGKQSVRQGHWKLVRLNLRNDKPVVTELYHLLEDPGETTNVAEDHPEVVADLEAIMEREHRPFAGMSLFSEE